MDTLDDVDIDEDVDTELEVDTLTGEKRQYCALEFEKNKRILDIAFI